MQIDAKKPIIKFADNYELMRCLHWWQKVLFLEDWAISGKLAEYGELVDENGNMLVGTCNSDIENKGAAIRVVQQCEETDNRVLKYCAELILVHEMLHCKRNWLKPPSTVEGAFWDIMHHQSLEEEARSYLLAKYDITKEWFSNVG